ncbi:MAG: NTP transferase domain-containing protein [Candidatus Abawacabacteria bacterium]|nr:NTP transferase domain-containing protein [Candidatus Abawacabacteria bacterium]
MKRILVIPTAGLATRLSPLNTYYPKGLIPLGDEPLIAKILALYRRTKWYRIVIIIPPHTRARFTSLIQSFSSCFPIVLVEQETPNGLLDAIKKASSELNDADQIGIHLADTLLQKVFVEKDFANSFVLTGIVNSTQDWCMAEISQDRVLRALYDKPAHSQLQEAIAGVYFFSDAQLFLGALAAVPKALDISAVIGKYIQSTSIYAQLRSDWQDAGQIQHLHSVEEAFCTQKKVKVFRAGQSVIKCSHSKSFAAEQYFYRHTRSPQSFPRLIGATRHKLETAYCPLRSLAYYGLYEPMNVLAIQHINAGLWHHMAESFYTGKVYCSDAQAQTNWMYGERVVLLVEETMPEWATIDDVKLNNHKIYGWPLLRTAILKRAIHLAKTARMAHIHGDFHLANILYDPVSHFFLLVDPRGMWGDQYSIYGDIRYDIAKFLHSFHGGYEYIKRGLSLFQKVATQEYVLSYPSDPWNCVLLIDQLIKKYQISLDDVLWIEGLCFLSMCRCYTNKSLRAQFFLQGLYLLNQQL